jgi:hypothetical protein
MTRNDMMRQMLFATYQRLHGSLGVAPPAKGYQQGRSQCKLLSPVARQLTSSATSCEFAHLATTKLLTLGTAVRHTSSRGLVDTVLAGEHNLHAYLVWIV